jgi:hypothetical protein
MRRLQIEQAADHCQIVLDPVMNFPQKGFLPFFTGAQLGSHLLGFFRLLHQRKHSGNHERKHKRGGEGYDRRKDLPAAEKMYTGIQIVTTSTKCVPPQAMMKSPNAINIQ